MIRHGRAGLGAFACAAFLLCGTAAAGVAEPRSGIDALLPDLLPYLPAGWSYEAVPRSTADATNTSAVLQAGPLPGEVSGTYWNWAMLYASGAHGPTVGTTYTSIALDDTFFADYSYGPGINPGTWVAPKNHGPTAVKGGRHTVLTRCDRFDTEPETDETNNDWYRQFIWSPLVLGQDAPILRTYDPPATSTGSGPWYNAEGFQGSTGSAYWYAFAVLPEYQTDDFDIYLNTEPPMNVPQQGFGPSTASSLDGMGAIDFVILDLNTVAAGTYWASVVDYAGTGNKIVEFDADAGTVGTGTWGPFSIDSGHLIQLHEVYMLAGYEYRVHVNWVSGDANYGVSVYDGTSGFHAKPYALPSGYSDSQPADSDEWVVVTPPATDYYGVAVWKSRSADLYQSVQYNLIVSIAPNLAEGTPSGWYGPVVPRNTQDATSTYAPLPPELYGDQTTTSYNWTTLNQGPNDVTAPSWETYLYVDDVAVWTGIGGPLASGSDTSWTNTALGLDPQSLVRGGRHHIRIQADALDDVAESIEYDNDYTDWFVWKPSELVDQVPLVRAAPPIPNPVGAGPYPSCDGLRTTPGSSQWTAVGILPTNVADDYDIGVMPPSTGSKNGFDLPYVYSNRSTGLTDIVAADFVYSSPDTLDYRVTNFVGSGDYVIQRADAPFEGNVGTGATVLGPFTLDTQDVLDLHEVLVLPEIVGPDVYFSVQNVTGSSDLDFAVFQAGGYHDLFGPLVLATDVGPGADEHAAPVRLPRSNYYAIAVFKHGSDDLGLVDTYNIFVSTDVLVDAPSVPALPTAFALAPARPNPFLRDAAIQYDVPAPGGALDVSVYDVAGRRIAGLVQGTQPPGRHTVRWNGEDGSGHRVGAGIYFVRLQSGDLAMTRKVTLLR